MFIQTLETPNPNCLKFTWQEPIMGDEEPLVFFKNGSESSQKVSPLANRLLSIEGIESVLLGSDFLAVTKESFYDWYLLKPILIGGLIEHVSAKHPFVIEDSSFEESKNAEEGIQDDIALRIREIINQKVRPAVAQDGGDIVFHSFTDGIVYVEMKGACSGCPSSTATLKSGIENMLRYYVPQVLEVCAL